MSRKGNCWDNACSETLFGSLKVERLHDLHFETLRQAKDEASIGCSGITKHDFSRMLDDDGPGRWDCLQLLAAARNAQ